MRKPEWYSDILGSIIHGSATAWGIAHGIDKLDESLALPDTDLSPRAVKARLARDVLDIAIDIQKREGFEGLTRGWPGKDSFLEQFFGSYGGAARELREMLKQSDIMHSVIVNFAMIPELGWELGTPSYDQDYRMPDRLVHEFLTRLGFLQEGEHISEGQLAYGDGNNAKSATLQHPTLPLTIDCFPADGSWRRGMEHPLMESFIIKYNAPAKAKHRERK